MGGDPDQANPGGGNSQEPKPTVPLTTPIREANGLLSYMGSDGRRYVVFGEPPPEDELKRRGKP